MSRFQPSASRALRGRFPRFGFTIIEMLAVLVIIGLLVGISIGRISATITQQRLNRAAIALSGDLESAFSLAQRDRKPVTISFDTDSLELSIADAASGTVFRKTSLANFGLKPSDVTLSRTSVNVYPAGLAGDSLSITLSTTLGTTTYSHRVRMTRGGLVQVK
jgi:prepilin-type N-terminal cleavage/methylation domain-containing protein